MRIAGPACLLIGLLLGAPAALLHAASAADARGELRDLRARIEALQKRLEQGEALRSEAADALKVSEVAISEANRRLRELALASAEAQAELQSLQIRAQQEEQALQRQRALLESVVYQHYAGAGHAPLRLLLSGEDPNRIARTLHYHTYVSRARAEAVRDLRASVARLRVLTEQARDKAAQLAALSGEALEARRNLERERQARSALLARISLDVTQQRQQIGTLKRNENRLTRLVAELARAARQPQPPRARNERVPEASAASGPFEDLKGRLRLPVRGELSNRFGSPRREGGVTWKGLFIAARAGEEVRAIADGRVVFADWLRGFGNLLIVDHGSAYMSLYGNNEALYRRVGDAIRGGDPIATVGNSGGSADSGLYFELRHEGRPLDPLPWVDRQ